MKKLFIASIALVFALAFASCKSEKSEGEGEATAIETLEQEATEAVADLETAVKGKIAEFGEGLFGTYKATLPAADAAGIEATLVINADLTYTLTEHFIEKDTVETTGKISDADFANKTITITDGEGDTRYFKVIEGGNLLMLTPDATEPENPEFYTFTRQ